MANKFTAGLALSLLISSSMSNVVLADDAASALEKQIMNGAASPSAGNPDNFPWMNKDGSVKPGATDASKTRATAAPPAANSESIPPAPVEVPKTTATTESRPEDSHATPVREEKLRAERAETATSDKSKNERLEKEKPVEAQKWPHIKVTPAVTPEHAAAEKALESTPAASSAKPHMLFGRIEQLSASAGASFPTLKAQTAQMDPRGMMQAKATATAPLQGAVVKSFPVAYEGAWGGRLVLQQVQVDPNYYRVDPEEARRTAQAMKPGNIGQVNFNFDRSRGAIALEPARCLFMVPAGDTQVPDEMKRMMGGNAAMGGMMSQMMAGMNVPLVLEFGDVQTGAGETSVSGNQMRQQVIKNEVRQLASNVLEQQIVTQETTWDKHTHRARTGYGESVLRFTRQSPTTLYVQAATVNYGADKKFLTKMVLYGSIGKGVVMNTDPMAAMNANMGQMGGMGGLGGLGGMFGGAGGARGGAQTPTMPAGGIDGMLKNLFGGQ